MPSPFPGMDPFIEMQEWQDFHARFNTTIADLIAGETRPKYAVRVEPRVYVESVYDDPHIRQADVAILGVPEYSDSQFSSSAAAVAASVECALPMPIERRETFLVIRDRDTMEVVTVIETVSPANKRPGVGRTEYLGKRVSIFCSRTNLVELDLLRGGDRLPMFQPLPAADYYAIIARRGRRPMAQVFPWMLRDKMPTIPIPLMMGDADVTLDLQAALSTVYDRAGYDLTLDYQAAIEPALDESAANWSGEITARQTTPTR